MSSSASVGPGRPDPSAGGDESQRPRTSRWWYRLIVASAVVSLLLLGAAVGLLIASPGSTALPVPGPDSVDVGFAQDMSVHHEQAVQMAARERDISTDPELRQLAYDIETGQTAQIGQMQGWLALWGAALQPTGRPYMTWMSPAHGPAMNGSGGAGTGAADAGTAGGHGPDRMPGMAADEELRRLRSATGRELDVLFLQLVLRHHEGAIPMARDAALRAEHPTVRNLATQMLTAQTAESQYLRQLLADRGATPLPS